MMKKFLPAALLTLAALLGGIAWGAEVIVIREKLFIQQCNDVYLNPNDYLGRTVRLEGIYGELPGEKNGEILSYVYRIGPGCCGYDGVAGFRVFYDGESKPGQGAWVEATGTVELLPPSAEDVVALRLSQLKVLEKRGAEYVAN
jgi:uncharacterized membrane protein YcgQ (UPF0703/DUF1980 family)